MSKYTAEDANAAAAKGAALLDERCLGWEMLLDLESLNLADSRVCILGQTAHCVTEGAASSGRRLSYSEAIQHLTGAQARTPGAMAYADEHGFCTPELEDSDLKVQYDDDDPEGYYEAKELEEQARWEMLNIAWREEIRKRDQSEVTA